MRHYCPCGKSFDTFARLHAHMGQGCYNAFSQTSVALLDPEEAAASATAKSVAERSAAAKRQFRDDSNMHARKRAAALWLADFRYKLLVPGTQVDKMKSMHTAMNGMACVDFMKEIEILLDGRLPRNELMQIDRLVKRHFDPYVELRTEKQEKAYLQTFLHVPQYIPRALPKGGTAYDFRLDEQILSLITHSRVARQQVYETLISWRVPNQHTRDDPKRLIVDIPDGDVFRDHPIFGDATRVSELEAQRTRSSAPMRIAILLWADGFTVCPHHHFIHVIPARYTCALPARLLHVYLHVTYTLQARYRHVYCMYTACYLHATCTCAACRAQPVNINNGNANSHSILAILYAIINLDPYTRTSPNAIQIATLVNEHDAKRSGMTAIMNDGESSVGAQLRVLQHSQPAVMRSPSGAPETHPLSVHCPVYTGDLPAVGSITPCKGSTSAHRYDKNSTLDQRSPHYLKPFSLLRPRAAASNSRAAFRRLTLSDVSAAASKAAKARTKTEREEILTDNGLCIDDFVFDGKGGYKVSAQPP